MATPLDRNLLREWQDTTSTYGQVAPDIFSNYGRTAGQQGLYDINNYAGLLAQLGATNAMLTGQANQQTLTGNQALRTANLQDTQQLAPQLQALFNQLNPNQQAALNAAQGASSAIGPNAFQTGLGQSFNAGPQYRQVSAEQNPLLNFAAGQAQANGMGQLGGSLQDMARQQLALGGSLSPEEVRNAQQAAREAWSARGLVNSNGAVAQEVLNRDALARQRLAERQQFAQNVNTLGQNQQQINQGYTLGVLGAGGQQVGQNLQGQMANQQAGLNAQQLYQGLGTSLTGIDYVRQQQNAAIAQQNAQLQSANAFNPFSTIWNTNTQNQGMNTSLFSQGAGFSSGNYGNQYVQGLMNPQNNYSNDVFGSNFNAANARAISDANNAAAVAAGRQVANSNYADMFMNALYGIGTQKGWFR